MSGVVLDRPDLTILDARELEWERHPSGHADRHYKVLDSDEGGAQSVTIGYMPAGFTLPGLPYRHYHSTVHEYAFVLGGELPAWEYESAEQQNGRLLVYRKDYFMHRSPGSLQGLEPGRVSPVGVEMLLWRSGPGTEMGEPAFDTETVEVPYAPGWTPRPDAVDIGSQQRDGTVVDAPDHRVLDTRALEWEDADPGGARRKVLERDEQGAPSVLLLHLPPGFAPPGLPRRRYNRTAHEFTFVLEGELPRWEYESAEQQQQGDLVVLKPGYFVHRRPGSIHGLEPGRTSRVGALLLLWRTGAETPPVDVPYRI